MRPVPAARYRICRGFVVGVAAACGLSCCTGALGSPAFIEFATEVAEGRGVHPVRLTVDTDGPPRRESLRFDVPPGARFVLPPPAEISTGADSPGVRMFHLLVLPDAPAGELVLRGSLGGRTLEARLPVRGRPDFRVLCATQEMLVAADGNAVATTLVVQNRGNTNLAFSLSSSGGEGEAYVSLIPDSFTLAAGDEREVSVVAKAPERSRVTTEQAVAIQVDGRGEGFGRIEPVVIRTLFVSKNPDPGPLFAQVSGTMDLGMHSENRKETFASQVRLSGEVARGVTLEAHALDGDRSLLGSQLALAGRDTWRIAIDAARWHAAAGEARAPSLGFLSPGNIGRGAVAGLKGEAWSADVFALRDRFGGLTREATGVRVAGSSQTWEAGAILQRNRSAGSEEERVGASAGLRWEWRGIKGRTEAAIAGSADAGAALGIAQEFGYRGDRLFVDARLEQAGDGFFLRDQSSERQSLLAELKMTDAWTVFGGADHAEQTGRLRSLLQDLNNTGGPEDPPEVVEIINQVATRQRSYNAGLRRVFSDGTLSATLRRQERRGEVDTLEEFSENTFSTEWTSRAGSPWWRAGMTIGRETGAGKSAEFAELSGSVSWSPTLWSRIEGSLRWTELLAGQSAGFRRGGVHGQVTGSVTPAKGWRAELRMEGYDFNDFEPRTRLSATVRFPLGRNGWSGAVEWGRDTRSGDESLWLAISAPVSFSMPWRANRGTIRGRIVDSGTGSGLASVLIRSGEHRAVSDEDGRYQLPAMDPGRHEISVQTPDRWARSPGFPSHVEIVAGEARSLDLALVELATIRGEVIIFDPSGRQRAAPAGVLVAEGPDGGIHETLVFRGSYTLRVPPGTYRLSYVSELPDEVSRQLAAEVTASGADAVQVRLEAHEKHRGIRKTLMPGGIGGGSGN